MGRERERGEINLNSILHRKVAYFLGSIKIKLKNKPTQFNWTNYKLCDCWRTKSSNAWAAMVHNQLKIRVLYICNHISINQHIRKFRTQKCALFLSFSLYLYFYLFHCVRERVHVFYLGVSVRVFVYLNVFFFSFRCAIMCN